MQAVTINIFKAVKFYWSSSVLKLAAEIITYYLKLNNLYNRFNKQGTLFFQISFNNLLFTVLIAKMKFKYLKWQLGSRWHLMGSDSVFIHF